MKPAKQSRAGAHLIELAEVVKKHESRKHGQKVVAAREVKRNVQTVKPVVLLFAGSKR